MSKARTIQVYGINDTISMYENMAIPSFAIWNDKEPMFPFECDSIEEGAGYLESILEKIKHSAGIYTLRVYLNVPETGIVSNTPFRGSFNFQLRQRGEDYETILPYRNQGLDPSIKILQNQIEALKMENKELQQRLEEKDDDEPEDANKGLGAINDFLNQPVVKVLTDKLLGFMNNVVSNQQQQQNRPMISGVPAAAGNNQQNPQDIINQSLQVLHGADPNLHIHLAKLAQLAQQDPTSFQFLLQTLDKL